ncbi:remodeling and spacing factor 1 isoform X2 [Hypomesus transpacificus]|uniref:remodeling and spacing factor 1 isoform X2 n=1 Tax=Hypomesus transpacificus TaxID=137520 RepID=UPI001F082E25|nr:remodeling and spacing factor 1 isoform X2 [Hypomesus transpacificus]
MAASAAAAGSLPGLCPSYAVICSFLERYGPLLDLPELTFTQLERYFLDTSSVPKLLVDLHVKLLRKIGKSVSADRWEKHLVKICQEFNSSWAWELEEKGYKDMTVECKTGILKYLCESQFDDNVKFKTAINDEDPEKMRLQPIGRDKDGLMYWFQLDQDNNVRVYVEEQDDLDGSSWKCIVRERNDLAEILALLKTQIDPSLLTKKEGEEGTQDENGGVKKLEDSSEDEEDMVCKATSGVVVTKTESKEEPSPNKEAQMVVASPRSPSNDVKVDRTESTVQPEIPDGDENISTNRPAIKEEPMEVVTDTNAKELLLEKPSVPLQTETGEEEVKKKSAEELQRAMKNDQQAKIPLKKREMKLSEDFDNSGSSIIVRNPSLPQVKDPQKVDESGKDAAVKDTPVDQVNGNSQHPTDASFNNNNGLKESPQKDRETQKDSADEKPTVAASGRESEVAEAKDKNLPKLTTVGDRAEDKQKESANDSEEAMEVTTSSGSDAQNEAAETKADKKNPEALVKTKESKESIPNEAESAFAKPLPPSKDEDTHPPGNSSDVKREERQNKCKEAEVAKADVDDKASASVKTHTTSPPNTSREPEGKKETSVLTVPGSPSKLEDPGKSKDKVASKDSKPAEIKDTEKPTLMTEKPPDCERMEVFTKETKRPEPSTDRPDGSKLSKTAVLIKEDEAPSYNKESRKTIGFKHTETSSVIQQTEILTQSKNTENLDSTKETSTSSVIKKADKPPLEKDTDSPNNGKEKGEHAVLKKIGKEEGSKPIERRETPVVTKETSERSSGTDSKGKEETNTDPKNIEKRTCLQLDEHKRAEKLAPSVAKTSIKDTETMPTKETAKTSTKDKEQTSTKDTENVSTKDTEKMAKTSAKDTVKEATKDKEQTSTKDTENVSTKDTEKIAKTSAKDTVKEATKDKEQTSTKDTENVSTKDAEKIAKTSAKDAAKEVTKDREKISTKDTAKGSTKETAKTSAKDTAKEVTKDREKISTKDTAKESTNETEKMAKTSAKDTAKEATKDREKISTKDTAKESTNETEKIAKTSAKDTAKEATKDREKISTKDTAKESTKETEKTSTKDTENVSTKEAEKTSAKDTAKESTKETEKTAKISAKDTENVSTKEKEKTEKTSAKDTAKESTKDRDKISTKDTAKEPIKDKGKTSTNKPEKPSSPKKEKTEACKGRLELAERKTDVANEAMAVPTVDSCQVPPKTPAAEKESKESVETSSKKSIDENTTMQKDSKKEPVKEDKSKTSSGNEVAQDQTPMNCEEPLKGQGTKKKEAENTPSLTTTEGEKDKNQDSKAREDAKAKGCPKTMIGEKNDEKPSAEAEKSSETKPDVASTEDKPNRKTEDEDKDEEKDPEVKEKGAEWDKGSSEVQEEGIRLKIKIPAHRRKADLLREERGDSESDTGEGRSLRRSPRICRPTPKVVEFQDRKLERKQTAPRVEKGEEREEEEVEEDKEKGEEVDDEEKTLQKKTREKKLDEDGQPKTKGRKRRRTRWSNTRTRRKKKGSDEEGSDDGDYESSDEDDSEDEDDSDEDYKVERNRKRRNRNRQRRSSDESTSSDDDLPPNDDPCKHCGLPNQPELILLCDSCDNGYHTACLRPPLMIIPDGEWFCPPCQHKQLCDRLEEQLLNLDTALKKRERAERRKERLVYVGISVENIITPSVEVEEEKEEEVIKVKKEVKKSKSWGRRSTRAKKSISYRFDEFDEAIEEAIEEDIKEAEGGGAGRGKDMANITGHRGKDMSTILQGEGGKENGRPPRPSAGQRRKKRRRLNDLDSDSTMEEEESEDEFRLSDSTEEEEFVVSENDAESDVNSNSDGGSNGSGPRHRSSRTRKPVKRRKGARQQPPRRRRRPRGYSDDEEEETDEEEEEEIATEGSSEFSDSDLDMSRRRSRRSRKKQVNYCETSESEGSRAGTNRNKVTSRRRLASSDSEASLSKGSDNERRVSRRADSSEEGSRQRRRRLSLKRRRASEDDDDDSDESEEEERPVRKRVNRIDSDDDSDEDKKQAPEQEEEEEEGGLGKGATPLEYNLVELPPTNGQSPVKGLEGLMNRPGAGTAMGAPDLLAHLGPKNLNVATPVVAIAPNGLVSQEMASQEDDEDDLLGVTDLVDYVCNSEQL